MGNQYLEEEKRKVVQNSTIADTLSAQSQVSDQYARKKYVDAQQMKKAKDKAYGDKKVTKDAYTGEEIHRDHGAAKRKYKGNASSHQGETDHTVSAKAAHSFAKNLPHITDADVKAAVNRQHNFKEISKKNNTSKGEKSNAEHAKGNKNLTTKAKAKMVAAGAKATVLVKGELLLKSTGRDSVDVAKNVASVKLAQFVQGEISLSDAVIDTACDTVKGEMNALAIRTSVNVAENALNATGDYIAKHVGEEGAKKIIGEAATKVFRFLGDNASSFATMALRCGNSVKAYINGEIDAPDMLIQVGEGVATTMIMQAGAAIGGEICAAIGATIGSAIAIGPGTVVGYLVGEFVGNIIGGAIAYIIGSKVCGEIANFLRTGKHIKELQTLEQMYVDFSERVRNSRLQLESYLGYLHCQHRSNIAEGFRRMEIGFQNRDTSMISEALDHVCAQFQLITEFQTRNEFEAKRTDPNFVFQIGKKR